MNESENHYWPYEVAPAEQQSPQDRSEVRFLETAYRDGYRPYEFRGGNFGADNGRRVGEILYRGCAGKHWEVRLAESEKLTLTAHVTDFNLAAEALLRWLRGTPAAQVLEPLRSHLFATAATGSGFVLHDLDE